MAISVATLYAFSVSLRLCGEILAMLAPDTRSIYDQQATGFSWQGIMV
jgi:hypothetical protein